METLRLDNTMLTAVPCSAKYVAAYVLGLRGKSPMLAAWVGNAFHVGFETWFGGGNLLQSEGAFYNEYNRLIIEPGYVVDDDRLGLENVKRIFRRYCETHLVEAFPLGKIIELERSMPVNTGTWEFWMKRDMLIETPDGMRAPLDHKSTSRINKWWTDEFRYGSQMTGYCYGTSVETGMPCQSAYINAVEVSLLPSGSAKCYAHKVPKDECSIQHVKYEIFHIQRTPEQIRAWVSAANKLAAKADFLRKGFPTVEYLPYCDREGQFIYKFCSGCEFNKWCRVDFLPSLADEYTRYEPWEPWNEASAAQVEQSV